MSTQCDLSESYVQEKLKDCFSEGCHSSRELAPHTENLGIQVTKQPLLTAIEDIVKQVEGIFLISGGVHAVGVDCKERLIYDCSKMHTVHLTAEAFSDCSIPVVTEVRNALSCKNNYSFFNKMQSLVLHEKVIVTLSGFLKGILARKTKFGREFYFHVEWKVIE